MVKDLRVSTQFPHGMRIHVIEQLPVGALVAGGETVAASADGTLLHDVPTASLPTIPLRSLPGGSRVTDQTALGALALLAASPQRLEARISQVTTSSPRGLVVQLRSGPAIYFGPPSAFRAKWAAAAAVLAAPASAGAAYIDVSDPAMPAAGVSSQALSAAGLATTGLAGHVGREPGNFCQPGLNPCSRSLTLNSRFRVKISQLFGPCRGLGDLQRSLRPGRER